MRAYCRLPPCSLWPWPWSWPMADGRGQHVYVVTVSWWTPFGLVYSYLDTIYCYIAHYLVLVQHLLRRLPRHSLLRCCVLCFTSRRHGRRPFLFFSVHGVLWSEPARVETPLEARPATAHATHCKSIRLGSFSPSEPDA